MDDIYKEYRNTLMNRGSYRAYFTSSRKSVGEYIPRSQYSPERHRPVRSEGERIEQHNEIQPAKTAETKPEIKNENEQSQKTETTQKSEQQKETAEQNEAPTNEKMGPPEYQQDRIEQADITRRNRPSPYHDKTEIGW